MMTMPASVPTSPEAGVPLSWPVVALKVAQEGLLAMEYVSVPEFVPDALGWNE